MTTDYITMLSMEKNDRLSEYKGRLNQGGALLVGYLISVVFILMCGVKFGLECHSGHF